MVRLYEITDEKRDKRIKRFDEGKYAIAFLNLKNASGINLQRADTAILFEPWWNPQVERQAEARIDRRGQTHPVTIVRFLMKDSIEETRVLPCQDIKRKWFRDLVEQHINTDDQDYD
jgi:DNA repair protein RAD16